MIAASLGAGWKFLGQGSRGLVLGAGLGLMLPFLTDAEPKSDAVHLTGVCLTYAALMALNAQWQERRWPLAIGPVRLISGLGGVLMGLILGLAVSLDAATLPIPIAALLLTLPPLILFALEGIRGLFTKSPAIVRSEAVHG